jgi:hypothetical protein
MDGHVARTGEIRKTYNLSVGKTDEKRPLERSRCRREDIRMDIR